MVEAWVDELRLIKERIESIFVASQTTRGDVNSISVMGQKRTSRSETAMSALPPKADIAGRQLDVRRSLK